MKTIIILVSLLLLSFVAQARTTQPPQPPGGFKPPERGPGEIIISGGCEVYTESKLTFYPLINDYAVTLKNENQYGYFWDEKENSGLADTTFIIPSSEVDSFFLKLDKVLAKPEQSQSISTRNAKIIVDFPHKDKWLKTVWSELDGKYDVDPLITLIEQFVKDSLKYQPKQKTAVFTRRDLLEIVSIKAANKAKPSKNIKFELDPGISITQDKIRKVGRLYNSSQKDETLIIFPVGMESPFYINFYTTDQVKYKPVDNPLPPAPPPPMTIKIAGNSTIIFFDEIKLDQYNYHGTPEVELNWGFHFWNDPKPAGKLKINLPLRK